MWKMWVTTIVISSMLLTAFACGEDKPAEPDRAVSFDRLEADVVIRAYEDGRLGTPDEVNADMAPYLEKMGVSSPIDASGRFSAYEDMSDRQQVAFNEWHRSSQKLLDAIGPEILRAQQDFLKRLDEEEKSE